MRNLRSHQFQRILIIKPSSLGDVIHALPLLTGLRRRYPRARISWLISTACAALLEGQPDLDEIIPFDRKRYAWIGRRLDVTVEFIRFIQGLRERGFDLVIDLQGLFRSGFMAWTSGARYRLGFAGAREFGWLFYSDRLQVPDEDMHAVDRNLLFARPLGLSASPPEFRLPVSASARAAVRRRLSAAGIAPGSPYVLIGPGTRWETKRWPAPCFAEIARRVRRECGLPVVLTGSPDERQVGEEVAELAGGAAVNLTGQTTLKEMVALVSEAAAVLMNDSGPMHIAAALGRPLVAIYGPTSPQRTGPYACHDTVIRLPLPCSPCFLKKLSSCPYSHRCLRELTPARVFDQLAAALMRQEVPHAAGVATE